METELGSAVAAWSPGWAAEGESPLNLPGYRITSSLARPGCLSALPETVFSLGGELQALRSQRCAARGSRGAAGQGCSPDRGFAWS